MTVETGPALAGVVSQASLSGALKDLGGGLRRWRLWNAFAVEDLRQTYRRSIIGVLWITLSFAIFVGVKIFIFGTIMVRTDGEYFGAYLMLGFFVWQFMAQVVNSGATVFVTSESWIRNDPIELPVFAYQNVVRNFFDLVTTGFVVILGLIYFGYGASPHTLMVIPAILAFVLNAVWVSLFLGVVSTRFRDVAHLVSAVLRVMLFLTPIFWFPEQLPEQAMNVLYWNPFAHFIWILRTPILDQTLALDSWIFVGVFTAVGWIAALTVYALARRRLIFWF